MTYISHIKTRMKFTAEDIQAGQILLVDKPLDWTSFNAVNKIKWKLKREFKLKKVKWGMPELLIQERPDYWLSAPESNKKFRKFRMQPKSTGLK